MVIVYALKSETGQIYVGITKDPERRFEEHLRRQSPSTKKLIGNLSHIYSQKFASYKEARVHEKYLKSGAGRAFLKGITT